MNLNKKNTTIKLLSISIILMIISMASCINNNNMLSIISYISCLASVFILILLLFNKKIKISKLFISFIIYTIYNIFVLTLGFSLKAIYNVLQETILIFTSICIINLKIDESYYNKIINLISKLYYCILSIMLFLFIIGKNDLISVTIYKSIFALSYFAFIKCEKKSLFCGLSFIIFFILGERTSSIILLIICFLYKFVLSNIKNKKKFNLIFLTTIAGLISFIYIYVSLPSTELGILINQYSRKISGENFFSGRNVIWGQVLEAIENNKIFGLTYNNNINLYYAGNLSTHNLYLWLLLNGGYTLLSLFIYLLYNLWNLYYKYIKDPKIKAAAAYFLGILILCNFELLLIVNNFSVSLFLWLTISMSLGTNKEGDKNEEYKKMYISYSN